jgi:hypothetical protein
MFILIELYLERKSVLQVGKFRFHVYFFGCNDYNKKDYDTMKQLISKGKSGKTYTGLPVSWKNMWLGYRILSLSFITFLLSNFEFFS